MAASPEPFIFTWPQSSTVATPSLLELNFTQRVTSAEWPSEYFARTTSCCSASGASTADAGNTSRPRICRSLGDGAGRAGGDPFFNHAVFERVLGEALAAAMGNRERWLGDDQACGGIGQGNAASHRTAGQRVVIGVGIVAAQRELESIFPGQRAVARALVAAHLRHHRDDVIAEAPGERGVRILYVHGNGRGDSLGAAR